MWPYQVSEILISSDILRAKMLRVGKVIISLTFFINTVSPGVLNYMRYWISILGWAYKGLEILNGIGKLLFCFFFHCQSKKWKCLCSVPAGLSAAVFILIQIVLQKLEKIVINTYKYPHLRLLEVISDITCQFHSLYFLQTGRKVGKYSPRACFYFALV